MQYQDTRPVVGAAANLVTAVSLMFAAAGSFRDANAQGQQNPSPTSASSAASTAQPKPRGRDPSVYGAMTFRDEFDGERLDARKWNTALWYDPDPEIDNYAVSGGALKIWAERNRDGQFLFVGRGVRRDHNRTIDTDGKFYQRYGYFEIEAKLPRGWAQWPAFWLYNHDHPVKRPEIDILEAYPGAGPNLAWGTSDLRPNNYTSNADLDGTNNIAQVKLSTALHSDASSAPDLSAGFHTYAVHWDRDSVQFFFDGKPVAGPHPTYGGLNQRMYVLLDLWLGGSSGIPDGRTVTGPGNAFEIRYVRAWALADDSTRTEGNAPGP